MAAIRKRGNYWRVDIFKQGVRKSRSFDTKSKAQAWATLIEAEILAGKLGHIPDKTFGQLLERYRDEVSATKRGEHWERIRINRFLSEPLSVIRLTDLSAADFSTWREDRLNEVSPATVSREMTLLSHACSVAVREWEWLKENPLSCKLARSLAIICAIFGRKMRFDYLNLTRFNTRFLSGYSISTSIVK